MTAHAATIRPLVRVGKHAEEAWLDFPSPPAPRPAKAECLEALLAAGVVLTAEVDRAIEAALSAQPPVTAALVATQHPARHGTNGRIEWTIDGHDDSSGTFYERSPYVQATQGQRVGRLHAPTAGEDGVDVRGHVIPARPGIPSAVKLDESLLVDARGNITAMQQGLLVRSSTAARIGNVLKTGGRVDFATGNIDFDGDVEIEQGVSDCFVVKASGSVTVKGVVEAATVQCGGDLTCTGGYAARGLGKARVGGSLVAGHLNALEATIGGDLKIDQEAIDCTLRVAGAVDSPGATFSGGLLECAGTVRIGSLGRPSGIRSTLAVDLGGPGPDPAQIAALLREIERLTDELQQLQARGQQLTAGQKERLTEIQYELHERNGRLNQLRAPIVCSDKPAPVLRVENTIHPNSVLVLSGETVTIGTAIRGPASIRREGREFTVQSGSGPRPLRQFVQRRAAA